MGKYNKSKASATAHKSEHHKTFTELFEKLTVKYSRFTVWTDFVTMTACAISNSCDKVFFEEREADYHACADKYTPEEYTAFAQMFSCVILALEENPEQDFLGDIFNALGLQSEWHNQVFTPYNVSTLMSRLNLDSIVEEAKTKDEVTVNDPCCGAGCLLIACANEARKMGVGQKKLLFIAQDIDKTVALMCYIQLSLLGCRAIVKVGDTFTSPYTENEPLTENIWRSPTLLCWDLFSLMRKCEGNSAL